MKGKNAIPRKVVNEFMIVERQLDIIHKNCNELVAGIKGSIERGDYRELREVATEFISDGCMAGLLTMLRAAATTVSSWAE